MKFKPGEIWSDVDGNPINAHSGGIVHHGDIFYWYGEQRPVGPATLDAQIGVSCYSSRDLYTWKFEGTVLPVDHRDPASPLAAGCKIERPKVLFNPSTQRFVMWWHHDLKGWGHSGALAGVAISDSPTGPFKLVEVFKPNWTMYRDCTLFQDDDGSAYTLYASDDNANLVISRLTDDYLKPTPVIAKHFQGRYMEAPCVFKRKGLYYFIGSDCTGWAPNEARSAFAPTIQGPWREYGNPCLGEGAELTFGAQGTFVFPVPGKEDAYIFMADQWRPDNLADSRYVWLPITFRRTVAHYPERPFVRWQDAWDLSFWP